MSFVRGNTICIRFVSRIHQNVCTASCVLSDIVKRRSVRVRITYDSLMAVVVIRARISDPFEFIHRKMDEGEWVLSVKLDRLTAGSILRSKLVFLIIVQPHAASVEGARLMVSTVKQVCGQHSAECVDIDNESNQVP